MKIFKDCLKNKKGKKYIHANSLEKEKTNRKSSDSNSGTSGSVGEALETYLCKVNSSELITHASAKQKIPT